MKWREITPEQDNWEKQINVVAYYGSHIVGSIVFVGADEGWNSLIDGSLDYMDADTEDEAKKEMIDKLENHFESEINYYRELIDMLDNLKESEG